MPHWLIKSSIQRAISLLPRSHWWNELFQTYVTRSLDLGANRFESRLDYCRQHVEHWFGFGARSPDGFCALELGTGWYPIVPLGLYLCGASEIWTFDIAPLLKPARLERSLRLFCEAAESGTLRARLPRALPERIARFRELLPLVNQNRVEKVLEQMKIHALVRDASNTGLPSNSVDLFVSTSVLEYIPGPVLANIFREFLKLSRAGAVMSHAIDLSDEYAYFDRSITAFNFLKYSTRQWNLLNGPLIWNSRLRVSDYRKLISESGWQILKELNTSGEARDLDGITLAPEFQGYSKEDLLVLRSWLVAKTPSSS